MEDFLIVWSNRKVLFQTKMMRLVENKRFECLEKHTLVLYIELHTLQTQML